MACAPPADPTAADTSSTAGDSSPAQATDTTTSELGSSVGTDTTAGEGTTDELEPDTSTGADAREPTTWRSVLYPEDWTPEHTDPRGRFLHDFSYAGYHRGELDLPRSPAGATFDVVDHGADPTGLADSTSAIQAAIDAAAAAGEGIVWFPAGLYRCDDTLAVTSSGVVLRGEGPQASQLMFTRSQSMTGDAHIELRGALTTSATLPLVADAEARSFDVLLADASALAPGDMVAVGWTITEAFVEDHGMTGTWVEFVGQAKPVFRRQVVAVDTTGDPHRVTLDIPLRYPALLRDAAHVQRLGGYLREVGVESLGVSNAVPWAEAWANDRVHAIMLDGVVDSWVRDVHSFDSTWADGDHHLQSGGVIVQRSARITVRDVVMERAQHRGPGGNGYLIEISRSGEVLVADVVTRHGRHNLIQNWDFGTSGCVFLRCTSEGSRSFLGSWDPVGVPAYCEYHHSLAMANLVDDSTLEDGWAAQNRGDWSSGAGHTATQSVVWNAHGGGALLSTQFGHGYVIAPGGLSVNTDLLGIQVGTEPEDWVETAPQPALPIEPTSLYEDQLARRTGR